MKPDIKTRGDIIIFVDEFYAKVQQDDLIGPVFTGAVKNWPVHLERMYNFWDAVLFSAPGFKGNPFAKHAPLPIERSHFDRWLLLFQETIDVHFEGTMAAEAKSRSELMAALFISKLQNMTGGAGKVIV